MKILSVLASAAFVLPIAAQTSTLTVAPGGVGLTYSAAGANFFDLVVTSPVITLRALEIPSQSPAGTTGTIQLWRNLNSTTHVGTIPLAAAPIPTGDPSGWTLVSSGAYTSGGFALSTRSCQSAFTVSVPNTELTAGTYAFAIVYIGVNHQFRGVVTYPAPAGSFTDGNIEVRNGTTQAAPWTAAPLGAFTFGNPPVAYGGTIPDFGITYDVGSVPHACGESGTFGRGSIESTASFFDRLIGAPATSAALQGRSLQLLYTPTGYVVGPGTGTFRPLTGSETVLPAVDDGQAQITLPTLQVTYPTNDGVPTPQSDLWVHSNGYVSTASQSPLFFTPVDPQLAMDAVAMSWYVRYHDYNTTEPGSGQVSWEEVLSPGAPWFNPHLFVTWNNVESYPTTAVNQSRMQLQIDLVTNNVTYVWDSITTTGGSTFAGGDNSLIGWSPAGQSPNPSEFDFTTLTTPFLVNLPETFPLTLTAVGQPLIGTTVDLTTTNLVGTSLGVLLLSDNLAFPVPGLPLPGAPAQTAIYLNVGSSLLFTFDNNNPTLQIPIANLPSLAGIQIYAQTVWFDLFSLLNGSLFPGLLSSNGVRLVIGNFQ